MTSLLSLTVVGELCLSGSTGNQLKWCLTTGNIKKKLGWVKAANRRQVFSCLGVCEAGIAILIELTYPQCILSWWNSYQAKIFLNISISLVFIGFVFRTSPIFSVQQIQYKNALVYRYVFIWNTFFIFRSWHHNYILHTADIGLVELIVQIPPPVDKMGYFF